MGCAREMTPRKPTDRRPWAFTMSNVPYLSRASARTIHPMKAWNDWYHVNGNTYGTWLRGDPRGWRARKHREHVEGDYRDPPPPGTYDALHARSQSLMKRSAVRLDPRQRRVALTALVEKLVEVGAQPIALSVDSVHYHILARFPDARIRHHVGLAKKHASHVLREHGLPGAVWAKRCRVLPISDRAHQVSAFRYIVRHAGQGASVWTYRDGKNSPAGAASFMKPTERHP